MEKTIKDQIKFITETLNNSYQTLQQLPYDKEVEIYIRTKLFEMTEITKNISCLIQYTIDKTKK